MAQRLCRLDGKSAWDEQDVSAQREDQSGGCGHPMSKPEKIVEDLNQHWKLCQDLLAIIEREAQALRRGLIPARELPSVNQQPPHFVVELYRRQSPDT
ncbi:MAG: hypothetical protein ABJC04_00870 [Verrucomicrobiota bacterium]